MHMYTTYNMHACTQTHNYLALTYFSDPNRSAATTSKSTTADEEQTAITIIEAPPTEPSLTELPPTTEEVSTMEEVTTIEEVVPPTEVPVTTTSEKKARKKQYFFKGGCNALAVQLFAIDEKYETR